ncbi:MULTISPECIES: 1,2-dihydroxy-3-keto-5-methylthiopentene dioxygenase [Aneurinibacillus]|jgi:1,2-dihydroxy-3-keto-5-methylthiopentene dioxygenase|uniref:Acireductone dioxygenase n=1 Tax=Aneurinibacillus thermoaerophilus TaxID=143495 RepID=A0A1G8A7R2_ANETH|nr:MULTISPECIES: cupin domain-containing protein [Aneurinibacillus]AMA74071.1 acireductone dioxygenase [Aneurinibacillus sp. XH2]MED0675443.1 cupin domain-containing protein [Aneurinibacillus thermoaerophilus]MED0678797.1 cupin domain-containing protein [Aneurinibacillus thermoaerophilus]MED0736671.1 cupin domain-containing protein [Aneurinibacillus thermoaerophilus]MED0758325.1 cupin domain-containing protein [Aneurinibacillus thermoaerophilus]
MAYITFLDTKQQIVKGNEVKEFLSTQDVIYEKWSVDRLDENLKKNYSLTAEEKQQIIEAFRAEIDDLSARRGYKTEDIVVLSDATPNLDALLDKFKEEHHHTDDEVRFCVDGHGIFTLKGKDGRYFDIVMEPGDLISVPAYTRHWFTLCEDRKIKCIRIFVTPAGWEAIYEENEVPAN